jgi:hypothetical protein
MATGHPKHRYPVDGTTLRMADGPVPIGCIYVVERDRDHEQARSAPLGFAERITALTEHAFHLTEEPEALARQAFERAAAVAGDVPVRLLRTPTGLNTMIATIAELSRLDATLS